MYNSLCHKRLVMLVFLILMLVMPMVLSAQSGVSIGKMGARPSKSAILDIVSVNKGLLIPRMTTVDRTNIVPMNTENGLLVYDIDFSTFWYWDGIAWIEIVSADNNYQNLYLTNDSLMIDNGNGIPYGLLSHYLYNYIADSLLASNNFIFNLSDSLFINDRFQDSLLSVIYNKGSDTLLSNHSWLDQMQDSINTHLDSVIVGDEMTYFYVNGIAIDSIPSVVSLGDSIFINSLTDSLFNSRQFLDSLLSVIFDRGSDTILNNIDWLTQIQDSIDTHLDSVVVRDDISYFYIGGIAIDSIPNAGNFILNDSVIVNLNDSLFNNMSFRDSLLKFIYYEGADTLLQNHNWLVQLKDSIDTHLDSVVVYNNMTYFYIDGFVIDSIPNGAGISLSDTSFINNLINTLFINNLFKDSLLSNIFNEGADTLLQNHNWLVQLKDSVDTHLDSVVVNNNMTYFYIDGFVIDSIPSGGNILLQDTTFINRLRDSINTDDQNLGLDKVNDTLTIEDGSGVSLAELGIEFTTIDTVMNALGDSLLSDTTFITNLGDTLLSDTTFANYLRDSINTDDQNLGLDKVNDTLTIEDGSGVSLAELGIEFTTIDTVMNALGDSLLSDTTFITNLGDTLLSDTTFANYLRDSINTDDQNLGLDKVNDTLTIEDGSGVSLAELGIEFTTIDTVMNALGDSLLSDTTFITNLGDTLLSDTTFANYLRDSINTDDQNLGLDKVNDTLTIEDGSGVSLAELGIEFTTIDTVMNALGDSLLSDTTFITNLGDTLLSDTTFANYLRDSINTDDQNLGLDKVNDTLTIEDGSGVSLAELGIEFTTIDTVMNALGDSLLSDTTFITNLGDTLLSDTTFANYLRDSINTDDQNLGLDKVNDTLTIEDGSGVSLAELGIEFTTIDTVMNALGDSLLSDTTFITNLGDTLLSDTTFANYLRDSINTDDQNLGLDKLNDTLTIEDGSGVSLAELGIEFTTIDTVMNALGDSLLSDTTFANYLRDSINTDDQNLGLDKLNDTLTIEDGSGVSLAELGIEFTTIDTVMNALGDSLLSDTTFITNLGDTLLSDTTFANYLRDSINTDDQNLGLDKVNDTLTIEDGSGVSLAELGIEFTTIDTVMNALGDSLLSDTTFITNLGDTLLSDTTFANYLRDSINTDDQNLGLDKVNDTLTIEDGSGVSLAELGIEFTTIDTVMNALGDSLLSDTTFITNLGDTLLSDTTFANYLRDSINTDDQNLGLDKVNDTLTIEDGSGVSLAELGIEFTTIDTVMAVLVDSLLNDTTLGIPELQAELDTTQKYAGLNEDGTYTANALTNYINSATTLDSADILLDAQVKINTDQIATLGGTALADLQNELDTTQKYAGLDTAGKYLSKDYTNYINDANTLDSATVLLDAQLKIYADSIGSLNKVWEHEVVNDADNNFNVGFIIKSNATIFYNGAPLRSSQWSGEGTTQLVLALDTRRYDFVLINNN